MIWFPVPDGVTSLPAKPAYTTNASPNGVNVVPAPVGFDPNNVDLEDLFDNIVATNVDAVYPVELDTDVILEPLNELVPIVGRIRSLLSVYDAPYSLEPEITTVALPLKSTVQRIFYLEGDSGSFNVTGQDASFTIGFDPISRSGDFAVTGQAALLRSTPIKLGAEAAAFNIDAGRTITVLSGEGSLLDSLEETDTLVVNGSIIISYDVYKFGSSSFQNTDADLLLGLVRRQSKLSIASYSDFTVSFWFNPTHLPSTTFKHGVLGLNSDFGLVTYTASTTSGSVFALGYYTPSNVFVPVIEHPTIISLNQFYHIAVEKYQNNVYLYVNGTRASASYPSPEIRFDQTNSWCLFNFGQFDEFGDYVAVNSSRISGRGYIDDFVIDSFGRYGATNFSAPTAPLSLSSTARLYKLYTVQPSVGTVTLSGQTNAFVRTKAILKPLIGSIVLTGQDVNFALPKKRLVAEAGAYNYAGYSSNDGPYFVSGSGTSSSFSGSTTTFTVQTFNPPTGYQLNDLIIFVAETSADSPTYPPLVGWNLLPGCPVKDVTTSAGSALYVWWRRVLSANEPAWSLPVKDHVTFGTFLIRGADPINNPIAVSATASSSVASTTVTAPSLTIPAELTRVFICAADPTDTTLTNRYSGLTNSSLTDLVEHFERSSSFNNGGCIVVNSGRRFASGVINPTTITRSTSATFVAIAFAVQSTQVLGLPGSLIADPGAINLTGQNANLGPISTLSADAGSYALTGQDSQFNTSQQLAAEVGSTNLSGQAAQLTANRILSANPGAYTLSGQNATFKVATIFSVDPGSYALTGQTANFIHNQVLTSLVGNIVFTGQDATFTVNLGSLVGDQFELTALLEDDLLTLDF